MDLTPEDIRARIEKDSRSGAYNRTSELGPLKDKDWFANYDMIYASKILGINAVYITTGKHWKTVLDIKRTSSGYQILEYDPIAGVRVYNINKNDISKDPFILSPGLEGKIMSRFGTPDLAPNKIINHLLDYFRENPTPKKFVEELRKRGGIQKDTYNCGPWAIIAAYEREDSRGEIMPMVEELGMDMTDEPQMDITEESRLEVEELPEDNLHKLRKDLERIFRIRR